jgi:hypothetical protein
MKIENPTALLAALKPVDMPIGLVHFDSDFCWCDPTIEVDDYGRYIIVHRQVTWNEVWRSGTTELRRAKQS